jgi:hypothetical protein
MVIWLKVKNNVKVYAVMESHNCGEPSRLSGISEKKNDVMARKKTQLVTHNYFSFTNLLPFYELLQ